MTLDNQDQQDQQDQQVQQTTAQHLIIIMICLAVLIAAFVIGRIEWLYTGMHNETLPSICTFKNATGIPCPGCGLTRSWVFAARGDWQSSLNYHRFGMVLMLYAMLQVFRHTIWLMVPASRLAFERAGRFLDKTFFILAGLLAVNWIYTLKHL